MDCLFVVCLYASILDSQIGKQHANSFDSTKFTTQAGGGRDSSSKTIKDSSFPISKNHRDLPLPVVGGESHILNLKFPSSGALQVLVESSWVDGLSIWTIGISEMLENSDSAKLMDMTLRGLILV